jgi:flagellar biosynthesis/type III secretory pathway protein FliH
MRSVPFIQDWVEEGIQQGRQEGYTQAFKESIISILGNKFGIVKSALLDELEKVKRAESLKMLLNRTMAIQTQEEFISLIKLAAEE